MQTTYDKLFNVLWTGGLDSTFRIAELSLCECVIQPYYIVDAGRKSIKMELKAIDEISKLLRSKKTTKAKLNELVCIDKKAIADDSGITASYQVLHEKYQLGTQYDWLARFAKYNKLSLEVSLETSSVGKASLTIASEGTILKNPNDSSTYVIDPLNSSEDLKTVFGNFAFPCSLWKRTKKMEIEWFKEVDLFDVAQLTWFCHNPVLGYPCGHCNPCKDALSEGMEWRVPFVGRVLGTLRYCLVIVPSKLFCRVFNFFRWNW